MYVYFKMTRASPETFREGGLQDYNFQNLYNFLNTQRIVY